MPNRNRMAPTLALVLYGAAATVLPLVHNAWHDRAHHLEREHAHPATPAPHTHEGHGHRKSLAHAAAHTHPGKAPARSHGPAHESDPRHAEGAPEHFGLALESCEIGDPAFALEPLDSAPPAGDPSVFQSSFRRTAARPRAPPRVS
jgi:hypothetical protein